MENKSEKPKIEEKVTIRANGSRRVQLIINEPTMTQQHMKEQCDVNSILERYRKTGEFNHVMGSEGQFGDFTQYGDFKSNLDTVLQAQEAFSALPAVVRQRFQNDPEQLIAFVSDQKNQEEAYSLGLAIKAQGSHVPSNDDKTTINSAPTT